MAMLQQNREIIESPFSRESTILNHILIPLGYALHPLNIGRFLY